MAITGSFKQQCPSCEAQVSIKDGSLIGKKVDCPKCKYRFVVEDPVAKDKKAVADKGKKNGAAETAVNQGVDNDAGATSTGLTSTHPADTLHVVNTGAGAGVTVVKHGNRSASR